MLKYRNETIGFDELTKMKTIPRYQRPLVWTTAQKVNFIDNVSKGFPFGSLLLYKYDSDEKYSLIDGQQRLTTLEDYRKNPELYFPVDSSPEIEKLMHEIKADEQPEEAQENLRMQFIAIIKEMFQQHAQHNEVLGSYLAEKVQDVFPPAKQEQLKVVNIQTSLLNALDDYVNLSTLQIPCVIFTGDKSELPEVFANVNLGGRKLSKYQVFAAQWDRYSVALPEKKLSSMILENTIARYEKLTDERNGLEIEDFSPEELRRERTVTLPEFCHALGELIIEACPAFWPVDTLEKDDTVDTIGYNSLAITFGIHPQEIAGKPEGPLGLPEQFGKAGFEHNPESIEHLLNCILRLFGGFCGRDSGIGPAQRAKTTIWN